MLKRFAVFCFLFLCVVVCSNPRYTQYQYSVEKRRVSVFVTACCTLLQYIGVCCTMLQCVASGCSVLLFVAVCCSDLQTEGQTVAVLSRQETCKERVTVCCSALQCAALCCSVLQCVAVCYSPR